MPRLINTNKAVLFSGLFCGPDPLSVSQPTEMTLKIMKYGGEGGIRTHDTVARMPHFECGAFDHSATSPLRWSALVRRGLSHSESLAGWQVVISSHFILLSSFYLDSFFALAYLRNPIGVDKSAPCPSRACAGHHRQPEFLGKSPEIPAQHRLIKRRPPVLTRAEPERT